MEWIVNLIERAKQTESVADLKIERSLVNTMGTAP